MEHQGTKTIETERLILRKFTADDLSAIFITGPVTKK